MLQRLGKKNTDTEDGFFAREFKHVATGSEAEYVWIKVAPRSHECIPDNVQVEAIMQKEVVGLSSRRDLRVGLSARR